MKREQRGLQAPAGVELGGVSGRQIGKQESPGLLIDYGAVAGGLD